MPKDNKPPEDDLNRDKDILEPATKQLADSPIKAVEKQKSASLSNPQLLRVTTIIKNYKIDAVTAKAVMTANRLKLTSRIEPAKLLQMVEKFRNRKIKNTGRR